MASSTGKPKMRPKKSQRARRRLCHQSRIAGDGGCCAGNSRSDMCICRSRSRWRRWRCRHTPRSLQQERSSDRGKAHRSPQRPIDACLWWWRYPQTAPRTRLDCGDTSDSTGSLFSKSRRRTRELRRGRKGQRRPRSLVSVQGPKRDHRPADREGAGEPKKTRRRTGVAVQTVQGLTLPEGGDSGGGEWKFSPSK
jgi:hypothetical protein